MKLKHDQNGVAHLVLLLIIVLVVGSVSFVGWKTWKNSQIANTPDSNTQVENNNDNPNNLNNQTSVTYKNSNNTIMVIIEKPAGWIVTNKQEQGETAFNRMTIKSPSGTYLHISDPTGFGGGCQPDTLKYTLVKKIPTASQNIFFTEYSTVAPNYSTTYLRIEDFTDADSRHKTLEEGDSNSGVCENVSGYSTVSNNKGDIVRIEVSKTDYDNRKQVTFKDISNDTEFLNMLKTMKIQK